MTKRENAKIWKQIAEEVDSPDNSTGLCNLTWRYINFDNYENHITLRKQLELFKPNQGNGGGFWWPIFHEVDAHYSRYGDTRGKKSDRVLAALFLSEIVKTGDWK